MGIIDDYLSGSSDNKTVSVPTTNSLINDYMATPDEPKPIKKSDLVPAGAPVGGKVEYITKEESKNREYKGGSTRSFPSLTDTIADKALEGLNEITGGVVDSFDNTKGPLKGLGRAGMGALSTLVSIPTGAGEYVDKIVGKPDSIREKGLASFGDKSILGASGALPVAGASKVARATPKNKAFSALVEDIGPENVGYVAKEMRNNPSLTPADLATNVRMGVQKLHGNVSGPHADYIEGVAKNRLKNAATDLEAHMDANLGKVVDPVEKLNQLKADIKEVGRTQINPAIAGAKPVNTSSVVKFMDDIAKPGINSKLNLETGLADTDIAEKLNYAKRYLTDGKSFRTDAESLNDIQSMFRIASEKLLASTDGPSKRIGGIMAEVRNKLVDAIDEAADGKYKPALAKYRDEFHIQDAFEYGNEAVLKNSTKLKDHPAFLEQRVSQMSDKELNAAREGARLAYDAQMNAFKHAARRGTDIGDVEFNRRRMTAFFGQEQSEKMFKAFEDAKKIAETNNKLVQGSQSRIQQAQNSRFAPVEPPKPGNPAERAVTVGLPFAAEAVGQYMLGAPGIGGLVTGGGLLGLKASEKLISKTNYKIKDALQKERDMNYAKIALPTDAPSRERLIQQLEAVANAPPKQSLMSKVRNSLPVMRP